MSSSVLSPADDALSAQAARPGAASGFRPDVQGLRAIAVSLVVVYHLHPSLVPGGYVGVDVFFVISGFLITQHLARTLERTGRVGLVDFYGRRARRLMPAAVLVLTVTWLVSLVALGSTRLPDAARQIRASALYFQNWVLAQDSVTYLKSDNAPSPAQHFWSLSVEEQFYLGWPLLFLLVGALALFLRRGGRVFAPRPAMLVLAVTVVAASLAYSIHETVTDPSVAYFVTPTRIWELGLGGVLALLPVAWSVRLGRVGPLAWLGLVMVGASAALLNGASAFPGSVALYPVVGAALMLGCGSVAAWRGTSRLTSVRPMVFLGDISYSLYLWHWPVIVLWKSASGQSVDIVSGPILAVLAVLLAWLTKRYVEDPFRTSRHLAGHPLRSVSTVVLVLVPVLLTTSWLMSQPKASSGKLDERHPGAAVLAEGTTAPAGVDAVPTLVQAAGDFGAYGDGPNGCQTDQEDSRESLCYSGDTKSYTKTIALVGDSKAGTWYDDLTALATKHHWRLVTDLHSLCPWSAAVGRRPDTGDQPYTACLDWGKNVMRTMLTRIKPSLIVTAARPKVATLDHPEAGQGAWAEIGQGMATYWNRVHDAGIAVAAIRETPEMGFNVPDCLARPGADEADCTVPSSKALPADTPTVVAKGLVGSKATMLDLNRYICSPQDCDPVVGNVVVYIDDHHITTTYARTVAPYLDKQLLQLPALRR